MTGLEALKKLDFYSDIYSANSEYLNIIVKELKALEIIANADTKTLLHYLATVIVNEEDWLLCKETIEKYKRC